MTSLRNRLLFLLLAVLSVLWGASSVATYRSVEHEVEELFDAELAEAASILADLTMLQPSALPAREDTVTPCVHFVSTPAYFFKSSPKKCQFLD